MIPVNPPRRRALAAFLALGWLLTAASGQQEISPSSLLKNLSQKSFTGKTLDIDFQAHDLAQIFEEFSRISGLRFSLDPDLPDLHVIRRFTLLGIPWDKALDTILNSCGLELRQAGDGLLVRERGRGNPTAIPLFLAGALFAVAALASVIIVRRSARRRASRARMDRKFAVEAEKVAAIVKELEGLFREEKIYRDPDLDLSGLADRLSLPPHLLSWIFNAKLESTFSDYLNRHRVGEVQEALAAPGGKDRTILEIAFDAGFNTKSAFYKAFRKMTGMAPGALQRKGLPRKS